MKRCCPTSCGTGEFTESDCYADNSKGTCTYPNDAQCPKRPTLSLTPSPTVKTFKATHGPGNDFPVDCIGHTYIGHNYIGHTYIGHNYIGHTYTGIAT